MTHGQSRVHTATRAHTHKHRHTMTHYQEITRTLLAAVTKHLSLICFWKLSRAKGCSLLQSGEVGSSLCFSFSLMESNGMGPSHLYLGPCPNRGDFCLKIALLSARLSCWARWESVKGISARWSVWLSGKTRCWWHIALMGSWTAPNPPSTQMTWGAHWTQQSHQSWLQLRLTSLSYPIDLQPLHSQTAYKQPSTLWLTGV